MSATTEIEVRCPVGPRNLLMKVRRDPEAVERMTDGNLLELSCRDCTRKARKAMASAGLSTNFRVLHRFDFLGELIESVQEPLG